MKCLLVADLHYSLKQLDWLLEAATGMDLVIVAGDHLDIAAHVNGPVQIAVVNKYFRRLAARAKTVVCSGNHDLDATNAEGEKYTPVAAVGSLAGHRDRRRYVHAEQHAVHRVPVVGWAEDPRGGRPAAREGRGTADRQALGLDLSLAAASFAYKPERPE